MVDNDADDEAVTTVADDDVYDEVVTDVGVEGDNSIPDLRKKHETK